MKILSLILCVITAVYANSSQDLYPKGKIAEMIKLGEEIIKKTDSHPLTSSLIKNDLKCVSCHLSGKDGHPGSTDAIGSFVGIAGNYPLYKSREGVVETLQDRVDDCFLRSMDGLRPITDTKASIAIVTYITWLSQDVKIDILNKSASVKKRDALIKKFNVLQKKASNKNYLNGSRIYQNRCASCHGLKGEGLMSFPPLWGKDKRGKWLSYNAGAGMSKLDKSAMWIQSNMPFYEGNTLKDQEAADVALYINAQQRDVFDLKKKLSLEKDLGYYNSKISSEIDSVESNFKALGLTLKEIKAKR